MALFFVACRKSHLKIVQLLLNDPRIDLSKNNHLEIVQLFM